MTRLDVIVALVLMLCAYGWLWTVYTACTC